MMSPHALASNQSLPDSSDVARNSGNGSSPGLAYFTLTLLALAIITLTGHLGGFLSGVETP
jgi:hypothetical protein